eukprot:UN25727
MLGYVAASPLVLDNLKISFGLATVMFSMKRRILQEIIYTMGHVRT